MLSLCFPFLAFQNDIHLDKEEIEDILLAVATQYIQKSYYKKSEDYKVRYMTKALFIEYIDRIVGIDGQKQAERIKFTVLAYIDNVFSILQDEIVDDDIANIYKAIYFSTKAFFIDNLETQEQRFKFLNTISTDEYEKLNREKYIQNSAFERERFLEHKDKIEQFIKIIWKIMYNINCEDFGKIIKEKDDCFFFEYPKERAMPVIVLSPGNDTSREASKTLNRILKMKIKPRKWYFKGRLKSKYKYSYDINKIVDAEISGEFSVLFTEREDCFKIECMDCVNFDEGRIEIKDPDLSKCLFDFNCIKGD